MNLLADECIDQQIVKRLRQDGHEVLYIAEMDPGISDEKVFRLANLQSAILIPAPGFLFDGRGERGLGDGGGEPEGRDQQERHRSLSGHGVATI